MTPTNSYGHLLRSGLLLAALALALTALLVSSVPALALSQRGHIFSGSFGSEGEGTLSDPGAIAVSQKTGDVYVLDRAHARIVQYGPAGEFISAWGWGVKKGGTGKEYEVCASGECNPEGISGHGTYQFNQDVMGLAVDNCTQSGGEPCSTTEDPSVGDVYVLAPSGTEYAAIDKFGADGEPLERAAKKFHYAGGCTTEKDKPIACEEGLEATEAHGLAVGPRGTLWLDYEEELYPISGAGLGAKEQLSDTEQNTALSFSVNGEPSAGLALDADGRFYIPYALPGSVEPALQAVSKWQLLTGGAAEPELEELAPALDDENTTAVTVNPLDVPANQVDEQNDVYVTNVTGEQGSRSTSVAEFAPDGSLIQRFSTEGLREGAGVAVNPSTGVVYVTDAATGRVDLFTLEEPGAPSVDSLSVSEVSAESARLHAQLDTDGASASYYFEYGTAQCSSEPSACLRTPQPAGVLLASYGDQAVQATLQQGTTAPLLPGTTYHYRVIVTGPHGSAASAEDSFTTPPPGAGAALADARVWEMVSPAEKHGAEVELGSPFYSDAGGRLAQAAEDGQALTYTTNGPLAGAEGNRSLEPTQMLAIRSPEGWTRSQDIVTPSEHAEGLAFGLLGSEYKFFSANLSLALVQPFNEASRTRLAEPPLAPPASPAEAGHQEKTIYLRSDQPIQPQGEPQTQLYGEAKQHGAEMANPGYVALVTAANVLEGAQFGSEQPNAIPLHFEGATPDLAHVVIKSALQQSGCEPGRLGCAPGLYEWSSNALHLISTLPGGEVSELVSTYLGAYPNTRHAISDDGARVFWSGHQSTHRHLFVSDTATVPEQTIQLDQVGPKGSGEGVSNPTFQTASPDGARVFFTDEQDLTEGAGATGGKPDLYVCEVQEDPGTHTLEPCTEANHRLTDLTPAHAGESAGVQGLVLGASEEGCDRGNSECDVYFLANGVLSEAPNAEGESATPGACGIEHYPQAGCNLYVERYGTEHSAWEAPQFIARLSDEDRPGFEAKFDGNANGEANVMTSARVSPNGRYLAFMSDRPLTGYDNRDAVSGERDEEVFLYEAGSQAGKGRLVCASCDPSGAQPRGVLDEPTQESEAGAGLLVDRNGVWAQHRLAGSLPDWTLETQNNAIYQPRYLSDSGRLYFQSPDDLLPQATNHKEDLYEYEPPGVPSGTHQCTATAATFDPQAEGCLGLISSGTATGEAAFLDASESGGEGPHGEELSEGGGDVFFVTAAELVPQDTEATFSVFDAHECTAAEPCVVPPEEKPPEACQSTETCRSYTPPGGPSLGTPASTASGASGNLSAQHAVLSNKASTKPKPLTRAQKLSKALKTCRSKYKHSGTKRIACEKQARKRYGHTAKKAKKATRTGRR